LSMSLGVTSRGGCARLARRPTTTKI
jgi:hypothetical protein